MFYRLLLLASVALLGIACRLAYRRLRLELRDPDVLIEDVEVEA